MELQLGEKVLTCKGCGGENLHFESVKVFRGNDDYKAREVISIGHSTLIHAPSNVETPNRLRELSVVFDLTCEACDSPTRFYFADHKGNIFVDKFVFDF